MVDLYKVNYGFDDLLEIMALLRDPEKGCPWDVAQTHESIRRNLIEEAYEAADAIDRNNMPDLREELGDMLLQVVFHAQMAKEAGEFDIGGVCTDICRKLIRRHPHVFGTADHLTDPRQTLELWEAVKRDEKGQQTYTDAINGVAKALPALTYAEKIQSRAKRSGFDWPSAKGAVDKIREETDELCEAIRAGTCVEDELGDLLFAAVNAARKLEIDPEKALSRASEKFKRRFAAMEQMAGDKLSDLELEEMIALWDRAKEQIF
ncbi:MAG: nucleoside triphosphate pyrophosphohydrolase [Clostridia bacterium]|nr:nucleoside triphosphate pyrophosphohydrolase [Clostridia bacterium]